MWENRKPEIVYFCHIGWGHSNLLSLHLNPSTTWLSYLRALKLRWLNLFVSLNPSTTSPISVCWSAECVRYNFWGTSFVCCGPKNFWVTPSKTKTLVTFGTQNCEKIDMKGFEFLHHTWKIYCITMLDAELIYVTKVVLLLFPPEKWMSLKTTGCHLVYQL